MRAHIVECKFFPFSAETGAGGRRNGWVWPKTVKIAKISEGMGKACGYGGMGKGVCQG